jgi:hypothetical protein
MKKILFALAALLLIGALIWWLSQTPVKSPYYKQVVLIEDNDIINTTPYVYLDTVVSLGMTKLGIRGETVLIQPMSDRIRNRFEESEGIELKAYIAEWMEGYTICINDDLGHDQAIDVISHELIHLAQYRDKDLILTEGTVVLWMGTPYDVLGIPYNDRPWERAAFAKQRALAATLRTQILE